MVAAGLMRYHAKGGIVRRRPGGKYLWRALRNFIGTAERWPPLWPAFGDAVRESFASMLFIGGCIMMFSVLIRVLTVAGVTQVIAEAFNLLLMPFGLSTHLGSALSSGLFEITIGTEAVSKVSAPLLQKAIVASAIIAWSGAPFTQVASMVHGTIFGSIRTSWLAYSMESWPASPCSS